MLGEHIEPAGAECLAIALALIDRVLGRHRFEEFKPVARHQHRAAGRIEPMARPPDPLQQAR